MSDRPTELAPPPADRFPAVAVALGVVVSLCITGYTFQQSNQVVYFLDALYAIEPETLARDWFTTNTLQYHWLYTHLTIVLERLGILAAGCFVLHLACVVALHSAWRSIVRSLGGDDRTYLASVVLYHIPAGGLGLGVYQFLQDGAFLASNVSTIAALVALAFWLRGRLFATAIAVGVSGAFHVNLALLLCLIWPLFAFLEWRRGGRTTPSRLTAATAIAIVPCLANLAMPIYGALRDPDVMPLREFVDLYIYVRHPHHFDARNWPLGLWFSILWPLPFAAIRLWRSPEGEVRSRVADVFWLMLAMQVVGLLFAGFWFVSETLVKLSLFRMSIYLKLTSVVLAVQFLRAASPRTRRIAAVLCCVAAIVFASAIAWSGRLSADIPMPTVPLLVVSSLGAAAVAWELIARVPRAALAAAAALALPPALVLGAMQRTGVEMPGERDPAMAAMCEWIRQNTPTDALILTPPHDSMFRLRAHRSTVVSFKHVPQLSGEFVEWKRRLDEVLGRDLLSFPRSMQATLDAMRETYADESGDRLERVSREFGCEYFLSMRDLGDADDLVHDERAANAADPSYWLYRVPPTTRPSE